MSTEARALMDVKGKAKIRRRIEGAPFTVQEAADKLNISPSTIYDLIRDGQIRARKVGVKRARYRIDEADLNAYWDACQGVIAGSHPSTKDHLS